MADLDADIRACFDKAPEEAVKFLRSRGWDVSDNWRDTLAAVRRGAMVVTGVMRLDVIKKVRDSLIESREEGTGFAAFKKEVKPILTAAGWLPDATKKQTASRIELIYRNTTQTALNAGRQVKMERNAKSRPYVGIRFVKDRRQSDVCRKLQSELEGKVMRIDNPKTKSLLPPYHHGCRDGTITYSEAQVKRLGLVVIDPDDIEAQPDEGFDTAPADGWEPDLSEYPEEDVKAFTEEVEGDDG